MVHKPRITSMDGIKTCTYRLLPFCHFNKLSQTISNLNKFIQNNTNVYGTNKSYEINHRIYYHTKSI